MTFALFLLKLRSGWSFVKPILTFPLKLPLWLILVVLVGGYAFMTMERLSAVREAVRERTVELLDGAEKAARAAELEATKQQLAEAERVAAQAASDQAALLEANRVLDAHLSRLTDEQSELNDVLEDLLSAPVADDCAVSNDLYKGLLGR